MKTLPITNCCWLILLLALCLGAFSFSIKAQELIIPEDEKPAPATNTAVFDPTAPTFISNEEDFGSMASFFSELDEDTVYYQTNLIRDKTVYPTIFFLSTGIFLLFFNIIYRT